MTYNWLIHQQYISMLVRLGSCILEVHFPHSCRVKQPVKLCSKIFRNPCYCICLVSIVVKVFSHGNAKVAVFGQELLNIIFLSLILLHSSSTSDVYLLYFCGRLKAHFEMFYGRYHTTILYKYQDLIWHPFPFHFVDEYLYKTFLRLVSK